MTQEHEGYPTRRTATRAPVNRPVRLHFDDSVDILEGLCENISIGGLFVALDHPRPPGTLVRFEMPVEGGSICGLGEVAWMRADSVGSDRRAGMGVKFRHLEQRDRQLIFKLVSEHIKERLAGRQAFDSLATASPEPKAEPSISASNEAKSSASPWLEDAPLSALESRQRTSEPTVVPSDVSTPSPTSETPSSSKPQMPDLLRDEENFLDVRPVALDLDAEPEPGKLELTALNETRAEPQPETEGWAHIEGDAEFDPATRPSPRRDFPLLPVLALLVLLLGVGGYLLWGFWPASESDVDGAPATSTPIESEPQGGTDPEPPASTVPADAGASVVPSDKESPESGPPDSGPAEEIPPFPPQPRPPEPLPVPENRTPPAAAAETTPVKTDSAQTVTPQPVPSATPPSSPGFTRVEDISWVPDSRGGVRVILKTDGSIPRGRYKHFRLGNGSPREVVRLFGVRRSFGRKLMAVSGPEIEQIRVGFHRKRSGNELHVVMDLENARHQTQEVVVVGSQLEVWIR